MTRIGLFAGSFDPPSLGHVDIIKKASYLFDHLIIGVTCKLEKQGKTLFSIDEKIVLLKKITVSLSNIEIAPFQGLAVTFAQEKNATHLVRSLRAFSSPVEELQMALANRRLGKIETVFLLGDERFAHISSTLIREIACAKGPLYDFVPIEIESLIRDKMDRKCPE